MTRHHGTLEPSYFDAIYEADPDPWRFETSDYEREKYGRTLDALPRARYDTALEVGCSIGVLTRSLADRCDRLIALDASALPLARARQNCADHPNVTFAQLSVPAQWPTGDFDLIVLSEVLYYLSREDVRACATRVRACLRPDGDVIFVHYTGETDYPLSGDEASTIFGEALASFAREVRSEQRAGYRLDVWRRST